MRRKTLVAHVLPVALAAVFVTPVAPSAETFVWVDANGVTHITDDPERVPEGTPSLDAEQGPRLDELWEQVQGEAPVRDSASSGLDERVDRVVRGAVGDLERGENARASAAFESALRLDPTHAVAHWYLAELSRQRARYTKAANHLEAFLTSAGKELEPWREEAKQRLARIQVERGLVTSSRHADESDYVATASENFRVLYDPDLGSRTSGYAETVTALLEEARQHVGGRLGTVPEEPMGVVLYGKAAYLEAHRHRFSFETVGFFDGRIHVVSAAHPERELRDLLFHEYTHAIFRERTGGDRPFWLNEGMAELSERQGLGRDGLTRGERFHLASRMATGHWIPLRRLGPGFSGLDNEAARAAYLQSTAAAAWLEQHTTREQRATLLAGLGAGRSIDELLYETVGLDTAGVGERVREGILAEFPVAPPQAAKADLNRRLVEP